MTDKTVAAIKEFLKDLYNEFRLEGRHISDRTLETYASSLKQFFLQVEKDYDEITHEDVRSFLLQRQMFGYSNRSLNLYLIVLRRFYKFLIKVEAWPADFPIPVDGFKQLKIEQKPVPYLPPDRLKDFIIAAAHVANQPFKTMAVINVFTGLRVSELIDLTLKDIIEKENSLWFRVEGKGFKVREVPLLPFAEKVLQGYLKNYRKFVRGEQFPKYIDGRRYITQWLWVKPNGKRPTRRAYSYVIKRIGEVLGIDLSPHRLRHTFATMLLSQGVELKYIQTLLGHASIKTTSDIYVHALPQDLAKAVGTLSSLLSEGKEEENVEE